MQSYQTFTQILQLQFSETCTCAVPGSIQAPSKQSTIATAFQQSFFSFPQLQLNLPHVLIQKGDSDPYNNAPSILACLICKSNCNYALYQKHLTQRGLIKQHKNAQAGKKKHFLLLSILEKQLLSVLLPPPGLKWSFRAKYSLPLYIDNNNNLCYYCINVWCIHF